MKDNGQVSPLQHIVMPEVSQKDVVDVIANLAIRSEVELQDKTKDQLEEYWLFKWDESLPVEWNVYEFVDLLDLYRDKCMWWEEQHNGSCCVVERVRDQYLMPKIKAFIADLWKHRKED